ncbi:MAG: hypothetical protein GC206_12995 [Alphaproteobacteria bacterium]|nr:hypothetical protein [Alphaproteobacteria bacterium]
MTHAPRLQPLRVPAGWTVLYNDFYETMTGDDLKEDLLQLRCDPDDRLIDVGWDGSGGAHGVYALVVHQGDFRGRLLLEFRSADHAEIVRALERLLQA